MLLRSAAVLSAMQKRLCSKVCSNSSWVYVTAVACRALKCFRLWHTEMCAVSATVSIHGATAYAAPRSGQTYTLRVLLLLLCSCRGNPDDPSADMTWSKWSFWLVHALLAIIIYATILILPFTPWRDLLPAKSSFYGYVRCLLLVYLCMAVGSILIGSKLLAGYCIYGIANWLYYAAYPPLLYLTFLADFFADDQLDMDLLYYSEMRDAGCFEDGFDEY